MAIRFYILPLDIVIHSTDPYSASRTPKYLSSLTDIAPIIQCGWNSTIYGLNNVALIKADISTSQHTLLSSQTDVIAFPNNLDNPATQSAIDSVSPRLEVFNIPTSWINTSLTYRQILRRISRIFRVFRRLHERFDEKIFDVGFDLDSQYKDFSSTAKLNLKEIALELGIDLTEYSNTTTVRQIVEALMNAQTGDTDIGGL